MNGIHESFGFLTATTATWPWLAIGAVVLILGYNGAPLLLWTALAAAVMWGAGAPDALWIVFGALAVVFNVPPLRQMLVSSLVMKGMQALKLIPQISQTEMQALKAGNVWVEGEYFSGKPDFKRMMNESYPELTAEEKAFIDNQVEKLCAMSNDWEIWQRRDLSPEVWDYIKKERFLGMIIPKEYGGLGFSALAHSEVLGRLASRSVPVCISVMVPNSLGPAELLLHYGTEAQKKHYLPRLARGEEIPCFALTEPNAGSDAGSLQSSGELFKGDDGKLYVKLNWNKRYITLAAISTTLGLAFRLRDPQNLLGKGVVDVGITCALIPTTTPGVILGKRHDPLGVPFYNCPTRGENVVVSVDQIIGGVDGAGHGWQMLMECLAAGRGISLPAQSTAGAKAILRLISGYAKVRKQFGMSVGMFHGIAEPLAEIAGFTYMLEGARKYTLGAIDSGTKPPVITAIAKYNFTELARKIVNHGMDIQGGAAISRGPRNFLAHGYIAMPISITVEGANILTRTLIIFGQGALRGHPYAFKEVEAVESGDTKGFDRAFWGHIGHIVRNTFRTAILSVTRGYAFLSAGFGPTARYKRKLAWSSAVFALMTDVAMGTLGGKLKTMGKLTGRFADVLSWMYLATGALRRWEAEGRRKEDLPFLRWSMDYAFEQIQKAYDGIFSNFDVPMLGWLFKGPIRIWSRINSMGTRPSDAQDLELARLIQLPKGHRERLTEGIFVPKAAHEPFAQLEEAFRLTWEAEDVERKVRKAVRSKKIAKIKGPKQFDEALAKGVISQDEFAVLRKAVEARDRVVQVDEYTLDEYRGMPTPKSAGAPGKPSTSAAQAEKVV